MVKQTQLGPHAVGYDAGICNRGGKDSRHRQTHPWDTLRPPRVHVFVKNVDDGHEQNRKAKATAPVPMTTLAHTAMPCSVSLAPTHHLTPTSTSSCLTISPDAEDASTRDAQSGQ